MSGTGRRRVDPSTVVLGMEDPAFACDELGSIVVWNSGAERLLGHRALHVVGRRCAAVVCGRDLFGNPYCTTQCTPRQLARRGKGIRRFRMDVRTAGGEYVRVDVHTIQIPGRDASRFTLIHVMDSVEKPIAKDGGARRPVPDLTRRELEVLRLLADGIGTRQIAERLFISVSTARKHAQNTLTKMSVHSRLEAVCTAIRDGLI